MKIKKFENISSIYKDDTEFIIPEDNILSELFKKRKDFIDLRNEVVELVQEYVEYNERYFLDQYFLHYGTKIMDIIMDAKLTLITINQYYITLRDEDAEELLKFLEDTELYKNQKKFNFLIIEIMLLISF